MTGKVEKDSQYLNTLLKATDKVKMPEHPRHFGIKMQAHHIISASGVRTSGLKNQLIKFGYNINELENLVFLPSTLQGACHLSVQLHRGNHTAPIGSNIPEDDIGHRENYHDLVTNRITELKRHLNSTCPATNPNARSELIHEMRAISGKILFLIENVPNRAPLTKIADAFNAQGAGCGCVDNVGTHNTKKKCQINRDHTKNQNINQYVENITYKKQAYKLKQGC